MIQSDDIEPVGEEDSDEEHDMDSTDGKQVEEPKEDECEGHSFLTTVFETFVEKIAMFKTRAGRAGLVHNFLRGLQTMTAPVPSGESVLFFNRLIESKSKTTLDKERIHAVALANKT